MEKPPALLPALLTKEDFHALLAKHKLKSARPGTKRALEQLTHAHLEHLVLEAATAAELDSPLEPDDRPIQLGARRLARKARTKK